MFGSWRHFLLIALTSLVLPVYAGTEPLGYLAAIGPAPLRFRAPLMPTTRVFVPPMPAPPVPPEPSKPVPVSLEVVPQPAAASSPSFSTSGPTPTAITPQPATIVNEVSSGGTQPTQAEEVVSPQMLLRYFSKSTNGVSTSVIAPLNFTPPRPVEQPSSKATYSIGK
jgi:hypothetical protein